MELYGELKVAETVNIQNNSVNDNITDNNVINNNIINNNDKKNNHNNELKDNELTGNEFIENAIEALQKEPSEEMLAHTLTVIRRRMNDNGQLIIAVEPPMPGQQSEHGKISSQQGYGLKLKAVKTADEKLWWTAFTSFDEEVKGADSVMSTFMTDIRKLFDAALKVDEIEGIILNPWNRTIMLDKKLIKIIIGA